VDWSENGAITTSAPNIVRSYQESLGDVTPLWVRQGGSDPAAAVGVMQLGAEMESFINEASLPGPWKVRPLLEILYMMCGQCLHVSFHCDKSMQV
jgi:hypothetical protein